jgi:hypothetical protein
MDKKLFDIPVLLITFNRPETTCHVFEQIRKLKPSRLYIFSDAPRNGLPEELELVDTCRCFFDESQINWECKVERWLAETNMGSALGISSAISWAFETCEKLIILEDDCLPHPTFFTFCKSMLDRYSTNDRVMHVSGARWNEEVNMRGPDHFFSLVGNISGWATWKRAWNKYDFWMEQLPEIKNQMRAQRLFKNTDIAKYWQEKFDEVYGETKKHTWSIQWQYTLFKNYGLAAVPNVNLISNIGLEDAYFNPKRDTELTHSFYETKNWKSTGSNVEVRANDQYERNYAERSPGNRGSFSSRIIQKFRSLMSC